MPERLDGILYVPRVRQGMHMKTFTAVIEKDRETGYYVGYVPGLPGGHSQGETLDELRSNLREAIELIMEDENPPDLSVEFVGIQQIVVA